MDIKYNIDLIQKNKVGFNMYRIDIWGWAFVQDKRPIIRLLNIDHNNYDIKFHNRKDVYFRYKSVASLVSGFHISLITKRRYKKLSLIFEEPVKKTIKKLTINIPDVSLLKIVICFTKKFLLLLKHQGFAFTFRTGLLRLKSYTKNLFEKNVCSNSNFFQKDKFRIKKHKQNTPPIIEYVPLLKGEPLNNKPVKIICFYLPQFHPIHENSIWWGEGFTEWTSVKPAQPQFIGHYQPHVPGELGYYNLLDPTVQKRQVELAKLYGIEGFCFYFYWFGGKRLLEAPIENYFSDVSLNLPFCLCWANENWTRRWDGLDNEILIAQQHSPEDDLAFIIHVSKYMKDSRYIRIKGKPLLLVYRPSLLPSAKETVARWRNWCRENGIGEIFLAYTHSFEDVVPSRFGFDAAVEFPPNNSSPPNITSQIKPLHGDFACNVYDWRVFIERSYKYNKPNYTLFRGVCPSWDNTPRRKNNSNIFHYSSPEGYQEWLYNAICDTVTRFTNLDEQLIFVNAWNEWAEGAYLEPDQRYGYAYLEATRMALIRSTPNSKPTDFIFKPRLAVVIHAFYEDIFDEILFCLGKVFSISLKLYVTTPHEKYDSIKSKLSKQLHSYNLVPVVNRGRDILPFLKVMPDVLKDNYDFFIKVHTKKSPHRNDGDIWRRDIFEKLLTEKAINASLKYLNDNPEIGILGPTGHIVPMTYYWGSNAKKVEQLAARMGIKKDILQNLNFVAGSMFMARANAIYPLLNLAIPDEEFEPESGQIDGTLAHAIERLFPVSALAKGLQTTCLTNHVSFRYKHA